MKIQAISRKTLNRLEKVLNLCMLTICFYWSIFNVSVPNLCLAMLVALAWVLVHEVLKRSKAREIVDVEKEISAILSRLRTKKAKLNSRAAYSGKVIYPRQFMSRNLNDHFDGK